ncbi:iron-containing alcohol dehydrogenase [Candidatus Thorarchaeota archaeon]|nr:MAG: iron-containing alcohol dehydrogenase [Candidatus Thorarchaeota archaeon]
MSCIGPATIVIAEGALGELRTLLKDYSCPLIVTDELIHAQYSTVLEEIIGLPCRWVMASAYPRNSPFSLEGIDIVIGFGGGASLDVAKLIARDTNLSWISVPTAASHDGIASEVATVSHDGYRYSERCKGPLAVIADTSIISKAPPRLKLAGLGDIICKASSLAEWKLAHDVKDEPFDNQVYEIVDNALTSVLEDDSVETLIRAEIDAGRAMSLFGSSRPCSGTEHAISHAMDRITPNLHGLQVAFATPICLYYLQEAGYSEYDFGKIQEFMTDHKMPTTFEGINTNLTEFMEDVHHALNIMKKRDRYSILEHLNVDDANLSRALRDLGY